MQINLIFALNKIMWQDFLYYFFTEYFFVS